MYRFLTLEELKKYRIQRESILDFYKFNAGKTIPSECIVGHYKNGYGDPTLKVDNHILKEESLYSTQNRNYGFISLYKEIKVDENKNFLLDF